MRQSQQLIMLPALVSLALACAGLPSRAEDAADVMQIVPGGMSSVLQQGNANTVTVQQRYVASGAYDAQNRALAEQLGDGNAASIVQDGSGHSAEITQRGAGNDGQIVQQDANHAAELQQNGNGLAIKIEQFGAGVPGSAPITVIQNN